MTIADGIRRIRHVFLRDLVLQASIGIYPQERGQRQRVRINVDLGVSETEEPPTRLEQVLDYSVVADRVRRIVTAAHTNLVESLAERIATDCMVDARVILVRVRVEKLDVFPDAAAAGVEIERIRDGHRPPPPQDR